MSTQATSKAPAARGPAEHSVRDQIVTAAHDYFAHYGYAKTTVADLAREIGFSKAYIYRFFESKQAIGEAIVADCLDRLFEQVRIAVEEGQGATDKLRKFAKTVTSAGVELFFADRKLYEIAALASSEKWAAGVAYLERLQGLLEDILKEGRENGEFERKTPLDEAATAIFLIMRPYFNPLLLQYNFDHTDAAPAQLSSLVLRSLSP